MRLLSEDERLTLWEKLKEKWDIEPYCYWIPLSEQDFDDENVLGLDATLFKKEFGYELLINILKKGGVTKVIELSENGYVENDTEIDIKELEPEYCGAEEFWCTQDLDWIIYVSHENSITFAGAWFVEQIKANYPTWKERLWSDMDSSVGKV